MKAAFVSAVTLSLVVGLAEPSFANLKAGLVAYYPFNGNANDETANGNNGVVHGAVLAPDRFGTASHAYLLSGAGDYIRIPDAAIQNLTGDLTLAAWVNTTILFDMPVPLIFSNLQQVSPGDGYQLGVYQGKAIFYAGGGYLVGNSLVMLS